MLYVFTCLSEKCIGTQNAIKCYSAIVPHINNLDIKFAEDEDFNKIWDKTPNQLRAMGIETKSTKNQSKDDKAEKTVNKEEDKIQEHQDEDQIDSSANPEDESKEDQEYRQQLSKKRQAVQNRQIVLREFIIDSDVEDENVTKMYFRQIAKLMQSEARRKKRQQQLQQQQAYMSESETDDEEDGQNLESMYISENFGTGKNDEKHAENMLQRFQESQNDFDKDELEELMKEEAKQNQ